MFGPTTGVLAYKGEITRRTTGQKAADLNDMIGEVGFELRDDVGIARRSERGDFLEYRIE